MIHSSRMGTTSKTMEHDFLTFTAGFSCSIFEMPMRPDLSIGRKKISKQGIKRMCGVASYARGSVIPQRNGQRLYLLLA
jgi:hypothetical protein